LSSNSISDFAGVNNVIQKKYKMGHNLRSGVEVNFDAFKARIGYAINGSPFGDFISGDFVRHTYSLGAGYRTKNNFYIDLAWVKTLSEERYFLFDTLDTAAQVRYNATQVVITVGFKF
jgi:long-subunit fatty acid transport protein